MGKSIIAFILMVLSLVGILGGIGYSIYCGAYVIAVGLVAAGYLAYPKFMECIKLITE